MKKSLLAGLAGAAALAAAGYAVAQHGAQARLDAAIASARASLGPDGDLTFSSAKADFLSSSARLTGVVVLRGREITTADEVVVSGVTPDGVGSVLARNVRNDDVASPFSFASLSLEGASVPGLAEARAAGRNPDPAKLSFAALRIEGLRLRAPGRETSIGVMSVANYGPGRRSAFSVYAIDVPVADKAEFDRVTAGRVSFTGFDLARIVADVLARRQPAFPTGDVSAEVSDVVGTKGGERVIEVARTALSVSQAGPGPARAEFAMHGIVGKTRPEAAARLAELGYGEVALDLEARATHDADTGHLEIGPVVARGRNMGEVSLRVELAGVPKPSPEARPEAMLAARFVSATLRYADNSLADRAIRLAAREGQVTEDAVRAQLASLVRAAGGQRAPSAAEVSLRDALAAFVAKPGTIEVSARPDQPMPLAALAQSALMAPDRLADRLRVTAVAK